MIGRRRPDPEKREQLAKIAKRFEEVAEKPEYKKIASIRGFVTLRRGLREYTLPPAERQAHVLSIAVSERTSFAVWPTGGLRAEWLVRAGFAVADCRDRWG